MRELLRDVFIIEDIGTANVFLLKADNGFALIDTGIFKMTNKLIVQIEQYGLSPADIKTVIVTHCHCDHIGGVTELQKLTGAKVAAHADDIPYILQEKVIDGPYHGMMAEEQRVMKRLNCNIKTVDIVLHDGDILDVLGGLRVIHVPGHTPGSIALYAETRRIMFFGDVIRNNKNKGMTIGLPEKFNVDTKQTIADAVILMRMPIDYALFGHGEPILEKTNAVMQKQLSEII